MPTYQVRCVECGGEKWPMLPERPSRYLCALCRSLEPAQREKRREAGQRGAQTRKSRQRPPTDATGGTP